MSKSRNFSHVSSVNIVLGIATLWLVIFGETIIPCCYADCFLNKDQQPLAFSDEIVSAGYDHPAIVCGYFTFEGAQQATRELLSVTHPPEAIFCVNDHMALACLQVAEGEFSLVPGKDISIVGFDDVAIANWPAFGLTTYAHPLNKIIERIIHYITSQLAGKSQSKSAEFITGCLVVRRSCIRST